MKIPKFDKNSFDPKIYKAMRRGLIFSFILCLISIDILSVYQTVLDPTLYITGLSLFKSSLFFACSFITYGCVFNKLKELKGN